MEQFSLGIQKRDEVAKCKLQTLPIPFLFLSLLKEGLHFHIHSDLGLLCGEPQIQAGRRLNQPY